MAFGLLLAAACWLHPADADAAQIVAAWLAGCRNMAGEKATTLQPKVVFTCMPIRFDTGPFLELFVACMQGLVIKWTFPYMILYVYNWMV
jgi:hypothetical protein